MTATKEKIEFKIYLGGNFFYIFPDGNARAYNHLLTRDEIDVLNLSNYNNDDYKKLKLIEKGRRMGEITIILNHTGALIDSDKTKTRYQG